MRVITRGEDGWWEGECKGVRGRFPASYVQVDDDDAPAEGAGDDAVMAFNVEEVQEQEQEQEQEEEQQKQQEAEQEYDAPEAPEEAARQKYSREDEAIVPWPLTALDQPPTGSTNECFYSWSDFRVFNQAPGQASGTPGTPPSVGLRFPPCLQLSQNFYKPRHAEKPRRVKNTIVCWKSNPSPSPSPNPSPNPSPSPSPNPNPNQVELLLQASVRPHDWVMLGEPEPETEPEPGPTPYPDPDPNPDLNPNPIPNPNPNPDQAMLGKA